MYDASIEALPSTDRLPWNKGKLIGQKPPLTLKQVWAIRMRLQMDQRVRDLALFNLAIDSKLRGCDLVRVRVRDVVHGDQVVSRATVMQRKTGQPVRFEVTEQTREAVQAWVAERKLAAKDYLFPSRNRGSRHLSTRQYARIVRGWVSLIGLDPGEYGTHSLRRTKATLIYRRTKNLRAVQLLLGHRTIQSTVSPTRFCATLNCSETLPLGVSIPAFDNGSEGRSERPRRGGVLRNICFTNVPECE